jgi:hypothetical protein
LANERFDLGRERLAIGNARLIERGVDRLRNERERQSPLCQRARRDGHDRRRQRREGAGCSFHGDGNGRDFFL